MTAFEIDGARIAYDDTGSPRPGAPTLVLLHGFPLSRAMWSAQTEGLARVARVVAPDLRGYGDSTSGGWPSGGDAASLDRYADDVAALIDHLDADWPVVLTGFSMGGYIAMALLRRHPGLVDGVVLMDTRAVVDSEEARATRLKMADKIGEWGAARVAELMRPNLFADGTPDVTVEAALPVIAATAPETIAASQRAMAARPDSTPLLGQIDKPALVVCGEHDAISPPAEMRSLAEAIPGARFVEIEGAGHMAPVERPDAVNVTLRNFLARVSSEVPR